MTSFAAGCGASTAAEKTATQTDSDTYSRLLADRYDDVFPDDRVLTVRIVMDDADWQSMRVSAMAKEYYQADIWIDDELVPGRRRSHEGQQFALAGRCRQGASGPG